MIKHGDIYQIGEHRIACGDCSDPALLQRLIGSERITLIATDVPYGVSYVETKEEVGKNHTPIANDQLQSDSEYASFTKKWLDALSPYLDAKNAYYIFNSDKMVFALRQGVVQAGFKVAQLLIWVKSSAVLGRLDYHPQHELVLYGWKGSHLLRKRNDKSVLFEPKVRKNTVHPTMKPVSLMRRLILNSTKPGDIVFDGYMGSGTTMLAAEQTKRRCFGVELEPKYVAVAIERLEQLTGLKAEKIEPEP